MASQHLALAVVALVLHCTALQNDVVRREVTPAASRQDASVVGVSGANTSVVSSLKFCVRIITGSSQGYDGDLGIKVNGVQEVSAYFAQGSTVLSRCYPSMPNIGVSGPSTNGWIGAVEASYDGGATYAPMMCASCGKGHDGASVYVDGDGTTAGYETACVGGLTCTFFGPNCIRITTSTGEHSEGDLQVFIKGVKEEDASAYFAKGSTVFARCYATMPDVGVRGSTTDGWIGAVEASYDGGTSYEPMTCPGCPSTGTALVYADGGGTAGAYGDVSCVGGATCSFHARNCVRITTGTSTGYDGDLKVYVDGLEEVTAFFAKGSTVLSKCYGAAPTIGVTAPTADGWIGSVKISEDGGLSYAAMICADCSVGTDGSELVVGGDGVAGSETTTCVGTGRVCFLKAPPPPAPAPPPLTPPKQGEVYLMVGLALASFMVCGGIA